MLTLNRFNSFEARRARARNILNVLKTKSHYSVISDFRKQFIGFSFSFALILNFRHTFITIVLYTFQIVDAILSNANESLAIGSCVIEANALTTASLSNIAAAAVAAETSNHSSDEPKQTIPIPTAIVKPKYQKAAFDDRQLPIIIACTDRNQPWYDRQCATSENSTTKKLPEFERKVKRRSIQQSQNTVKSAHTSNGSSDNCSHGNMFNVRSNSKCSATKEKSNALDVSEKDTNSRKSVERKCSSVAIVQPRKKEKMDERKLMETIVQMQIKKNSVDNKNNNQKWIGNAENGSRLMATATTMKTISAESPKDVSGK